MTTLSNLVISRRRLLGSSALVAVSAATGCNRSGESPSATESAARPLVPLRVTLVGAEQDAETITRAWQGVAEHPIEVTLIPFNRAQLGGLAESILEAAARSDVVVLPLAVAAEAIEREFVVPLSAEEFGTASESWGEVIAAARNGAARFAGEFYAIPLGAALPFLLSSEETELVGSWEDYDRLVESWDGQAGEPTAPGWAAAMFLWRTAAQRNWLFQRDDFKPLVDGEPYVRALDLMVRTCSRYQAKSQTPQQIWDGVTTAGLRGGIGFPELRSQTDGIVFLHDLPGTAEGSRVLLDAFSPVITLASSCRQTAIAKQFMIWISGGEGSQSARRQIAGMTDTRAQGSAAAEVSTSAVSAYDLQLMSRLASPVTMPTLQLLAGADYYGALDQQVIRALRQEATPEEALAAVADQWQAITRRVGEEKQLRVWRRVQGMRG